MRSLALFNNKGGVGKTTLTFNIAHMLAQSGKRPGNAGLKGVLMR